MMLHVPNVLTAEQVGQIRNALAPADWVDGRSTVGDQDSKVKNNRQLGEHSPLARQLGRVVLDAVRRSNLFISAALPLHIVPRLFNHYEGGETYGIQVDGSIRPRWPANLNGPFLHLFLVRARGLRRWRTGGHRHLWFA